MCDQMQSRDITRYYTQSHLHHSFERLGIVVIAHAHTLRRLAWHCARVMRYSGCACCRCGGSDGRCCCRYCSRRSHARCFLRLVTVIRFAVILIILVIVIIFVIVLRRFSLYEFRRDRRRGTVVCLAIACACCRCAFAVTTLATTRHRSGGRGCCGRSSSSYTSNSSSRCRTLACIPSLPAVPRTGALRIAPFDAAADDRSACSGTDKLL
jgi:hypothetical protein